MLRSRLVTTSLRPRRPMRASKSLLIERRDSTPLESYHEIIVQLTIDRCICETLRFVEENGIMRPTMHSHILNNADGTQSDLNCLR